MIRILSILFVVIIVFKGYSQKNDSINYEILINKSRSAPDSARVYLNQARQYANVPWQTLEIDRLEVNLFYQKRVFDSALWKIDEVLGKAWHPDQLSEKAHVQLAKLYIFQGQIFRERGDYQKGTESLLEAKTILEALNSPSIELHEVYINIGMHYKRTNQFTEAKRWIEKSLTYALEPLDNTFITETFRSYGDLGLINQYLYQPNLALEYYELCLSIIEDYELVGEEIYQVITHNNIAMSLESGLNFDSAAYHYELANRYLDNTGLTTNQIDYYRGSILGNIAVVAFRHKNYTKAKLYAFESLNILKKTYGDAHDLLIDPLRIIGESSHALGENERALIFLNQSLMTAKKSQNITEEITSLNALGNFFFEQGERDSARMYYDRAASANRIELSGSHTFRDRAEYFYTLKGMVQVLTSMEEVDLPTTERIYEELFETLKYVYERFDNQTILEAISPMLEDLYSIYDREFIKTERKVWMERLWRIAETNKAIKLKSQLKAEYSLSYSIPDHLLEQERALRDSIDRRISRLKPTAFDSTLFAYNRRYENLIERFEKEFPEYYELKRAVKTSSLEGKQKVLLPDELLLNFFQGEDHVFMIAVSKDRIVKKRMPYARIHQLIESFNEALMGSQLDKLTLLSREMTDLLNLDEVLFDGVKHIFIVPDGIIWKLNFGAIHFESSEGGNALGNQYTQSYHYHCGQIGIKRESDPGNEVLAFSYSQQKEQVLPRSYYAFRDLNQSIPGASDEVMAISRIWKGDYYFAENANETRFKNKSGSYDVLHLAVHGIQNEQFPENSFLQFADKDSLNDGRLHAYELYNLKIDASLAVLTACNSGEGKIVTGEGMMSLGRAFAYAGVESLLASRWEVPDVSAPFLMKYFYEGLKGGMRKSEALQYAQKKYLDTDADHITSSPFFWAGFYVIGDDNPIVVNSKDQWVYLLLVLVFFSAALTIYKLYFRRTT